MCKISGCRETPAFCFENKNYLFAIVLYMSEIYFENKNDENNMDYLVVSLCRGLADYDANEIVSSRTTDRKSRNCKDRHSNDNEG